MGEVSAWYGVWGMAFLAVVIALTVVKFSKRKPETRHP